MTHNVFLGSLDRVLLAMTEHMPVHTVIAPRQSLRNMRLEKSLKDSGTHWVEVADRHEYQAAVAELGQKDCCVVAGFSWRIQQDFVDSAVHVINFHPGDLYRCRGPMPLEAALCHQHEAIGVSAHRIDSEQMDVGPLLARELISVQPGKGFHWHKQAINQLCYEMGCELFAEIVKGELRQAHSWDSGSSHWYERPPQEVLKQLYSAPSLNSFYQRRSAVTQPLQ